MKLQILFLVSLLTTVPSLGQDYSAEEKEKVTGIGGLFFRSKNPGQLAKWYEEHLGVSQVPASYEEQPWQQEAGATVFAPFAQDSDYFGQDSKVWMINFRVSDLDAMVQQLRKAGIAVEIDTQQYPNGRFARLYDPEGNPIQLWEPSLRETGTAQ